MRRKEALLIIISFVAFLFFPLFIRAYDIKNFYINATINSDGSITVQEYIDMNGEYNGINREVLFMNDNTSIFDNSLDYLPGTKLNNGTDIKLKEIKSVNKNDDFNFKNVKGDLFSLRKKLSFKKNNVYEITDIDNGYNYKIYLKSSKNKAFYIKYNIDNIVVLHNDVAELGWNLLSRNQNEDIERLIVTINNLGNKNILSWVHGEANVLNNVNEEKVQYIFNNVSNYTPISIRVIFDSSIIDQNYYKKTYINAVEKIKKYEENPVYYDQLEKNRKIIENAKEYVYILEKDATIYNYNNALDEINSIYEYNEEARLIKKELSAKMETYKDLPNQIYINNIKENIKKLKKDSDFSTYIETIKLINENQNGALDNELKESLMSQTLKCSSKVQKQLIESAKKNSCYISQCYYGIDSIKNYISETYNTLEIESFSKTLDTINKIKNKKTIETHIIYVSIDIGILFVVFVLLLLNNKIKEAKANKQFGQKYLREIPKDYSLEKLSYLLNKNIDPKYVSSVLLKLINEGVVICKRNSENDICLEKNISSKRSLSKMETLVLNFYLNGRDKITIKDLKRLQKKHKNSFINKYRAITKKIENDMKYSNLYVGSENKLKKINIKQFLLIIFIIILLFSLLPFIWFIEIPLLLILMIVKNEENIKIIILLLVGACIIFNLFTIIEVLSDFSFLPLFIYIVFFILFFWIIKKMITLLNASARFTKQGYTDYGMWLAFKRYLCDFSSFKKKDILEIHIWNEYMIYANMLGCSKRLLKEIKLSDEVAISDYDNYVSTISTISEVNSICKTTSYDSSIFSSSSNSNSSSSWDNSSSSNSSGCSSSFGGGGSVGRF